MNAKRELHLFLDRVGRRFRQFRLLWGWTLCWAVLALIGLGLVLSLSGNGLGATTSRQLAWSVAFSAFLLGLIWWALTLKAGRNRLWIARQIEARHPDLAALLLAAVEQEPRPGQKLGYLQLAVVEKALAHGRTHHWDEAVSSRSLWTLRLANLGAFAAVAAVVIVLAVKSDARAKSAVKGVAPIAAGTSFEFTVQPGNAEIEKGNSLLVTATFAQRIPSEATLRVEGVPGSSANQSQAMPSQSERKMTRNLEDPIFAALIGTVNDDLIYRVEFPGGLSDPYRVKVFEFPDLRKIHADLEFPKYTNLPPKRMEDIRHLTVVEGTKTRVEFHLNKVVARAMLLDEQGVEVDLAQEKPNSFLYWTELLADRSRRFHLKLKDTEGRENKADHSFSLNVTKNQPPAIKVVSPGRDTRVSPLEELNLKAQIQDDFGLAAYGVELTLPDGQSRELKLSSSAEQPKKAEALTLLDLEALKAQPDQVVSYYFWAEDFGPDGKIRRTSGDMYFAEVRHFEEIFRQGEGQENSQQQQNREQNQQAGGNAGQAEELSEIQKQIVNGIWKLVRRETGSSGSDKLKDDLGTLLEAQKGAIEKAGELKEKLEQAESLEFLEKATGFMGEAEKQLNLSQESNAPPPLKKALSAAQAAYQALLKLRAREFDVSRSNSRQSQSRSQSSSRSPSQQQLRQLDLTDQESRYETQSAAREQQEKQAQQDKEKQETRELAEKLKELARRQNDLTERLKELQAALEQAKEPKQKEELQRQLKRLQEQQQQVLRDTDELGERMEQGENRDKMAQSREQVEQTRENVRQASDALDKEQLSRAINEGTRAGRQLDQLKEDFRKQAGNRFAEEMREMRQQAREVDETQKDLTKQLDQMKSNPAPSLRDTGEKENIQKALEGQKNQVDKITERMKKTVEESESTEPLLAQELFNTTRRVQEQKLEDSLKLTRQLVDVGAIPEGAEASRKAEAGTEQLRKGLEKAAESVLGGQTDALKRAQKELDELANQLNGEIARATGEPQGQPMGGQGQPMGGQGQPMGGQGQPMGGQGQPMGGQGQPMGGQGQPMGGQGQPMGGQGQPMGGQGQPMGGQGQPMGGQGLPMGGQGRPSERRSLSDAPPMNNSQENREGQAQGNRGQGDREQNQGGRPNASRGEENRGGGGAIGPGGPIREQGFREWYDRMRAAEDLIDDPQLRAEGARIRERVRDAREEFKRHAKEPDWNKLKTLVSQPLNELRQRVSEELRKRESPDSLVPIDRDPVPPEFAESVRRYYERLGSDK